MKSFKSNFILLSLIFIASCSTSPRIIENGVLYSEYFQDIQYLDNGKVKIDSIETLGKERYPGNYQLTEQERSYLRSPDTAETVFEIYVTNNTKLPINISFYDYKSRGSKGTYGEESYKIRPGQWIKTKPKVSVSSVFGPKEVPYFIDVKINGIKEKLAGNLHRKTLDELRKQ